MKLLYTLIILFALSFANDELHFKNGTIYYGVYTGTSDYKVFFKSDDNFTLQIIDVNLISHIIDDGNAITVQDLQIQNKYLKASKSRIGGLIIAAGAVVLHTYPDATNTESKTIQWRVGIVLISIGGLLIMMGV